MAVNVLSLFLMVPWVGLRFVIVAFPGHTHLPFVNKVVTLWLLNFLPWNFTMELKECDHFMLRKREMVALP